MKLTRRNHQPLRTLQNARGVTLVELMIGLLVGLLATLVIAQALGFVESQKRTTTGGTDAQVNGALALHAIGRDVQMAGYGLSASATAIGCQIKAQNEGTDYTLALAPVVITDGAGGAPDTIKVLSSNKPYALPYLVTEDHPRTAANFFVGTALGIAVGDLMLAVPATVDAANWCSLFNVTGANGDEESRAHGSGQGQNQIIHNSGSRGPWNQPGGSTIFPAGGYPAGSYLLNLGNFIERTYAISATKSLTLQTKLWSALVAAPAPDDLFPHIVQLQALYGKDTNNDGVVDTWDNTTPALNDNAAWRQVIAVRIAIVARSDTYEKAIVTRANPQWEIGAASPVSIDVGAGVADAEAQHYRYKVFESIVPIRNVIWKS
ncbi:PilW family protein [Variovorax paradoxus]|nr:PilW family protein [Variovorax paradoxus]